MTDLSIETNLPRGSSAQRNLALLGGVTVRVSVEVGSASLRLADLLELQEGGVIELDRQADDLLDVFANGTLIARGEVVGVDGRYGIRLIEVVAPHALPDIDRRG